MRGDNLVPSVIPWDEIDPEIRPLVSLLNKAGMNTVFSCSGHSEEPLGPKGYVSFGADDQGALCRLMAALQPVLGPRVHVQFNQVEMSIAWVECSWSEERSQIEYTLRIEGFPIHAQRARLGVIEMAVKGALEATSR